MNDRQYQGVQLSKKESELIQFLQTGSNRWHKAYYIFEGRKIEVVKDWRKIRSWFNRTLLRLHNKDIALNIPFVWSDVKWSNPGIEASKANLVIEQKQEHVKELSINKPIL